MKTINLHPDSEEGKRILSEFITEALGQEDDDWFALRLNIKTDPNDNTVKAVYVGTGWQTPRWAEMSDRGPSFSEKQQFQKFFNNWFAHVCISPNPSTPETVADFFRLFLVHIPQLSEYFQVTE